MGLAKVVKSNLGKPGLSKDRVGHLTDEIALAEIGSCVGAEYPFQPEEPSRPPLRLLSCHALMENALAFCSLSSSYFEESCSHWKFIGLRQRQVPGGCRNRVARKVGK